MDSKGRTSKLKPHPQEKTSCLSDLFICWTLSIFKIGLKKELSEEDIYQTLERHDSSMLAAKMENAWNEQLRNNTKPSLWKTVWTILKWEILTSMFLDFLIEIVLKISRPVALGMLLGYYSSSKTPLSNIEVPIYASCIIITQFLISIIAHNWMIHFQQMALKIRVAGSSLIYRKSLRLSKKALAQTTVGQIVNLIANDMQQLAWVFRDFNGVWMPPVQSAVALYMVYNLIGPTGLVGVIFVIVICPLQMYMSKKTASYRLKIALKTDERIKYMSEIISGIQIIKMFTWEESFTNLVDSIRRKEMYFIKVENYLNALTTSFGFFIDRTAIFLCILTYVLTGNNPSAQYVFVLYSFYAILMNSLSFHLPYAVSRILQSNVSVKRLEKFLSLEEAQSKSLVTKGIGVKIENATAIWTDDFPHNTLTSINLEVKVGETVALIGPVGSGKSSLLNLCLGELPPSQGTVHIGGKISYASQEPWLFGGTVKQNILFGEKFNNERYRNVIEVCALEEDILHFPQGDKTIVGERGILLSGGQKARINLARAIYRDADLYLLDDPLSAVDASVGKHIFNSCIKHYLKEKSVVLVTHQIQFLNSVDKVYLMEDGEISAYGTYNELQVSGDMFKRLISATESEHEKEDKNVLITHIKNDKENNNEEFRQVGKVSRRIYAKYIHAGATYFGALVIAALFISTAALCTGSDYFLTFWVNLEQRRYSLNISESVNVSMEYEDLYFTKENCIYIYTTLIAALIIFVICRSLALIKSCMLASIDLHDKMFTSLVNATMNFFFANASGRILNRFSKDIASLDEVLPNLLMDFFQILCGVSGSILGICIVSPWALVPTAIIVGIMYFLRMIYIASSRSLKRIESTKRSPIFSHLTESIKGLTTIRSFDARQILEKEFDQYQNVHSSVLYMFFGANRAFAIWLDLICVMYVTGVTIIALIKEPYGGTVGFLITQGMGMTGMFQWGIRQWSELENQMTSVERVVEYIDVKRESKNKIYEPPVEWPQQGNIQLKSVFMRYSPDQPYVLMNLNAVIKAREKVGIVGRTGAGKSSLTSVLFRLVDFEGHVVIDNVDTKDISLHTLRSNISIIPQEPILFSGSVRKNLDPFDQFEDDQVWKALEEVKLKEFITRLPSGLYSNLTEGGSNFSAGQKQLICLARALLGNTRILMLDEATANVDAQTDELLQTSIRKNFEHCTVLTIAHRIHTIMDSDKVLVMDDGHIVEYDHPHILLQSKQSFYKLVMETGNKMSRNLMDMAEKNYNKQNNKKYV